MSASGAAALVADARTALQRGDVDAAAALCRRALAADAANTDAWVLLGVALRQGDPVEAESALRRAIALRPAHADAHFHLGNLLRERAQWAEAVAAYRVALSTAPDHPALLNNLGLALLGQGDEDLAEQTFRAVLAKRPTHPQALGNLAHVLCRRRQYTEARVIAERALALNPAGSPQLWIDLGIAQRELGDPVAAAASFRRAVALDPHDAAALVNLATVLSDAGDFAAAEPVLVRAVHAAPDDANACCLLAYARQQLCSWTGLHELHATVEERLTADAPSIVNPFHLLAMSNSPGVQQRAACRWAARIAPAASPPVITERGDRLRIGYVSADFRVHALASLAVEVWERHDRQRVRTFAYALPPPDRSPMRERIRAAFDVFRDMHAAPAEAVAAAIRQDGIDVLVDLNGYTTHSQPEIFARRPARVQLQWLGYLGTMGAPWMNGVVTDAQVTPPPAQRWFDERLLYLPDCYCPSDTRRRVAPAITREASGLPADGLVFCCFNNPYKLLPEVFDVWMRLLGSAPRSILWLSPAHEIAIRNLVHEAERRGIDATRLVFAPRAPLEVHLARHAHADLYLDTLPYNAGTAANDALFMGVPVLTCSGETMASRVAGSQLHAIGLDELVTSDLAAYEAKAQELATRPERLRSLREALAQNRRTYPLFDMERFTRAFEELLVRNAR